MIPDILIGLVNVFGWGLKPLLEKNAIKHSSFLIFANTRYIATAIISFIVLGLCKRKYIMKHMNMPTVYYSILVAIIGLVSIISNYYLLTKYDASLVAGLVEPALILVTFLFGYLFFNETFNKTRLLGILIISTGLFVTYKSK